MKKTAVLLIGFGGPRNLAEVQPFLSSIVDGTQIPEARLKEVYRHYEVIGGKSSFNEITERQKKALEDLLKRQGQSLIVGSAYRHSTPSFKDAFEQFQKFGVERVIGFVLASFRSFVSREWYHDKVAAGRKEAGAEAIEIVYTNSFDLHPLYLEAQAERIKEAWTSWSPKDRDLAAVIFTAHSIPSSMCEQSTGENENRCYGFQFYEASAKIASSLGLKNWRVSYQSRSGNPRDRWLEPDVKDVIRSLDPSKTKNLLFVPIGFLCDNVEIIYDLDTEAKKTAESLGFRYQRAGTVSDHPRFIEMMASQVKERLNDKALLFS